MTYHDDNEPAPAQVMAPMRLGAGGPQLSPLGLGCMRMSGPPAGRDDAESIATIIAALEAGVSFLDTGDYYGAGHNEMLIGEAISGRREKAFLSVKFGALRSASAQFLGIDVRPAAVKNFAAYSLQRLGVDVIDLYQPGRLDPDVPIEDTVGAVADLIAEGKVRYLGLSEVNAQQLRAAHQVHPVTALQIEYSLASRFIEPEILPTARELGIGVVAYGVTRNLQTVHAMHELAQRKHCSPTQLALAWVLSRGPDILALVGMSRRSRIPENIAAFDIVLTDAERAELDRVFAPGAIAGDRYKRQGR